MTDKRTRRDLLKPVQLLGLAFAAAAFAGIVALVAMGFFQALPAEDHQRAIVVALVVAGVSFIATLLIVALLLLAVDLALLPVVRAEDAAPRRVVEFAVVEIVTVPRALRRKWWEAKRSSVSSIGYRLHWEHAINGNTDRDGLLCLPLLMVGQYHAHENGKHGKHDDTKEQHKREAEAEEENVPRPRCSSPCRTSSRTPGSSAGRRRPRRRRRRRRAPRAAPRTARRRTPARRAGPPRPSPGGTQRSRGP